MSDWIVCAGCQLRHSARPDGLCPRCHAPAAGPPVDWGAPAEGALPPPGLVGPPTAGWPSAPTPELFPLGARLGGWVLYANALVALVGMVKLGVSPVEPRSGFGGLVPLLIDVVVATYLVAGKAKARGVALIRVGLGALVFTPIAWSNGGPLLGLLQLAFSLGLLALLIGRAGPLRMASGLLSSGGVLLVLLALMAGSPVAGRLRGLAADLTSGPHLEAIAGKGGGWRLALPAGHWHEVKSTTPDAERAFKWPEEDAHVFVFVKSLPGAGGADLHSVMDQMVAGARTKQASFAEQERRRLLTGGGQAVAVRATTSTPDLATNGWFVVHQVGERLGLVVALGPAGLSTEVEDELLAVGGALELEGAAP